LFTVLTPEKHNLKNAYICRYKE